MALYRISYFSLCVFAMLSLSVASKGVSISHQLNADNTTTTKSTTPITTTPITQKTTTSMPPTTTSTPSTTTSAPAPPTPTPAPTPAPTPLPPAEVGLWSYTDSNNKTCVIVQMAVQLNVTYESADSIILYSPFDLPVNSTKVIKGSCGNNTQSIVLGWPSVGKSVNSLTLDFMKNTTTEKFSLDKMEFDIVLDEQHFPKSKDVNKTLSLIHSGESFTTPLTMSYLCSKPIEVILMSEGNPNSTVTLRNLQVQAFHTDKGHVFGNANDCSYVDVPDIVPIAVGCALGGLIVVVLVAYLIGRHRRQTQGYLSM